MLDAAVMISGCIAGTVGIFLHAGMPIVPWDILTGSALTFIAPVAGVMHSAPASGWFWGGPFSSACALVVVGLLVLQLWKKTGWAIALGVLAVLAWCFWCALYHLAAIYASC